MQAIRFMRLRINNDHKSNALTASLEMPRIYTSQKFSGDFALSDPIAGQNEQDGTQPGGQ